MPATTEKPKPSETKKENVTAEDFFGKQKPVKGNTQDFIKGFQERQKAGFQEKPPGEEDGKKGQQQEENVEVELEKEGEQPKLKDTPKKGGFVKGLIDEKKTFEEKYNTTHKELESANQTIAELKKQLEAATGSDEAKQLRDQLNEETRKRTEIEDGYKKTVDGLQSKINFRDIQEDPRFVRDYVKPIADAHSEIVDAIKSDRESMLAFDRIKVANDRIYTSKTQEDREKAIRERDGIREELMAGLQPWQQAEVSSPLKAMFRATDNYHKALGNWVETRKRIIKESEEENLKARNDFLGKWHSSYKAQGSVIEEKTAIPENVQKFMETNNITFDLSKDERIALLSTQQGEGEASIDDTNRLIHQGRVYGKLMAQIEALTKMVQESEEYINKLKGSSGSEHSHARRDASDSRKTEGVNGFISNWNKKHGR